MAAEGSQTTKLGPGFDVTDVEDDPNMQDDAQSPYRDPFGNQEEVGETSHAYSVASEGAFSEGYSEAESEPIFSVRRSASRQGRSTIPLRHSLKHVRTLRSKPITEQQVM